MSRPTSPHLRTGVAVLLTVALFGCQDSTTQSPPPQQGETPSEAVQADPRPPRFAGRLEVQVQAGLVGVGGANSELREYAAPGLLGGRRARTYAPSTSRSDATLVRAHARLSPGHADWTTTFRFDGASHRAVRTTASTAAGVGGVLLVMTPDRRVLLAVRSTEVDRGVIHLTQLAKPEAWRWVTALPGA